MRIGIYPGSFDPVTQGHLDIILRASKLVDKLIIGVLVNGAKKTNVFHGRTGGTASTCYQRLAKC